MINNLNEIDMNYRKTIHRIARKRNITILKVKETSGIGLQTIIGTHIPGSKTLKVIQGLGINEETFFLHALYDSENLTDKQRMKIKSIIDQRS